MEVLVPMRILIFLIPSIFMLVTISCNSKTAEKDIVLVDVDTIDRHGIANEITIINSLNPKAIAIDIQFSTDSEYDQDVHLMQSLEYCKKLIMVSNIRNYNDGASKKYTGFTYGSLTHFTLHAKTGFGNTVRENDRFGTLKRFSTAEQVGAKIEYHFAVETAMAFDSIRVMNFLKGHPKIVDIDYRGGQRKFKKFTSYEVLNRKLSSEDIEGKIVLIGFMGPGNLDKFFTPLNRSNPPYEPDMYGLEYLANIIAQILEYSD